MYGIRPDAPLAEQGLASNGAVSPARVGTLLDPEPKGRRLPVQVTDVQKALKGADYPASGDDLVALAESNGADADVVDALRGMDGGSFDSPADVMKGLGGALGGED
jgi:hypothetical protein